MFHPTPAQPKPRESAAASRRLGRDEDFCLPIVEPNRFRYSRVPENTVKSWYTQHHMHMKCCAQPCEASKSTVDHARGVRARHVLCTCIAHAWCMLGACLAHVCVLRVCHGYCPLLPLDEPYLQASPLCPVQLLCLEESTMDTSREINTTQL